MLQTPIHVSPSNGEVLHSDYRGCPINFTFQGDLLTFVQGEIQDEDDPTKNILYLMPEGGHLSKIYNGQTVSYNDKYSSSPSWIANRLTAGANYKHMARLFQHYPSGLPNAGKPLADIYYGRGKIMAIPEGTSVENYQTVIASGLDNIKEPYYYTWNDTSGAQHKILCGAIFMEIRHTVRMITSYDKNTGVISFGNPVYVTSSTDKTVLEISSVNSAGAPANFRTVGMPYRLFTNYIETGWYDFKWRHEPTATTTILTEVDNSADYHDYITDAVKYNGYKVFNGIEFESTYTQAESVGLKWYKYQIYQLPDSVEFFVPNKSYHVGDFVLRSNPTLHGNANDSLYRCIKESTSVIFDPGNWKSMPIENNSILIEDMDKQFTYELRQTMPINPFKTKYVVSLQIATQDNDVITLNTGIDKFAETVKDADDHSPKFAEMKINDNLVTINDNTFNCNVDDSVVKISWKFDGFNYNVFRREIYDDGTLAKTCTYVGFAKDGNSTVYDYTVGNNRNYRYELVAKSTISSEYGKPIAMCYIDNINVKWNGWRISNIIPSQDYNNNNRKAFTVGDEWEFISAIDSGDIARNINSVLHVGTSNYAQTTRMYNDYESGTFTANLLTLRCPSGEILDDIQRVKAWMNFISGDNAFLLKSEKGDVWVINIANSPTRQYDETINPILTKITYEWAESANVDKCVFFKG